MADATATQAVSVETQADAPSASPKDIRLDINDLSVHFSLSGTRILRAVDGVSVELRRGETLGIIGESGSGKSTLGRAIIGLDPATSGAITLGGDRIDHLSARQRRRFASQIQMIFQDLLDALDPRLDANSSIAEPVIVRGKESRRDIKRKVANLLEQTELSRQHGLRRPHELSCGQRQRVNIARPLALDPEIRICDEAVSALDVPIQADILNLLVDLQEAREISYLFISHDIGVVSRICDLIGVTRLGQLIESGQSSTVIGTPRHPTPKHCCQPSHRRSRRGFGRVTGLFSKENCRVHLIRRPDAGSVPAAGTRRTSALRHLRLSKIRRRIKRPLAISRMNSS